MCSELSSSVAPLSPLCVQFLLNYKVSVHMDLDQKDSGSRSCAQEKLLAELENGLC